jgi:HTH-type transcriptional regulator, competence development regulator
MDKNLKQFGEFLQAARKRAGLSLRAAEEAAGVSNAYLSQLEQGKIKQPSPTILHKLSEIYQVAYEDLLTLIGYPVPGELGSSNLAGESSSRIGPVTADEEDALIEYLQFLRSRGKK